MLSRCPSSPHTGTGWIPGWRADVRRLPSARHLGAIADGAEAAGAPDDHVRELRARECRSAS